MQVHMTQDTHTHTHTHTHDTLPDNVQQLHAWQPSTYAKAEAACAVLGSWWWAVCRPKYVELLFKIRNNKILITLLHLVGIFTVRRQWTLNQTQLKFLAIRKNTLQCFSLFFSSQINTDLLILFNLIYLLSLNFNKSIYITDWINMWPHDRTVLTFKNPASYI